MSKLDDLVGEFEALKKNTFDYNRDFEEFVRQISELSFIGEIDHNKFYMSLLEQVFVPEGKNAVKLVSLTDDQREQFYTKRQILDFASFKIANSLHVFINLDKGYVQVYLQKGILDKFGSPKDDYGVLYSKFLNPKSHTESFDDAESLMKAEFIVSNLDDSNSAKKVFTDLMKVVQLSKTNAIDVNDFDLKIYQNVSKYWGNLNHSDRLIDDEYQETSQPEMIGIPHDHKKIYIPGNKEVMTILEGPSYDEINYRQNGCTLTFTSTYDAENLFYSVIDYINKHPVAHEVHLAADPQKITYVEKHYLSNMWPLAKSAEEATKLEDELTKYEVSLTRFHDSFAIKMEVWENGIVYVVTNVWDRRSLN